MRSFYISTISALFALLTVSSCLQDKCGSIKCENGGICVDGRCACKFGFEGDMCEDPWYSKFLGDWQAEESTDDDTVQRQYLIKGQFGRSVDTFKLSNFADTLGEVLCVRNTSLSFNILETIVNDSLTIASGQGTIDSVGSKVTGVYSFKLHTEETSVNFIWTR